MAWVLAGEDHLRLLVCLQLPSGGNIGSAGERGRNKGKLVTLPRAVLGIADLSVELLCARLLALEPVDQRDMDSGLARPDLVGDGFGDGAAISDYVVEAGFAGLILPNRLGSDQPGASTGLEPVMREAEPMDAEVGHLRHVRERGIDLSRIFVAVFFGKVAGAEIWRVADDGVGIGPGGEEG